MLRGIEKNICRQVQRVDVRLGATAQHARERSIALEHPSVGGESENAVAGPVDEQAVSQLAFGESGPQMRPRDVGQHILVDGCHAILPGNVGACRRPMNGRSKIPRDAGSGDWLRKMSELELTPTAMPELVRSRGFSAHVG